MFARRRLIPERQRMFGNVRHCRRRRFALQIRQAELILPNRQVEAVDRPIDIGVTGAGQWFNRAQPALPC